MDDIIGALHAHELSFNTGASFNDIHALEEDLGCALPPDLIALYRDHNGTREALPLHFRLMSIEELREWHDWFVSAPPEDRYGGPYLGIQYGIRAFWTDDNSNFAGVFLEEPLVGRVCFLDHEGSYDLNPVYRSIRSFLLHMLAAAEREIGAYEMDTDYPEKVSSADSGASESDWSAVQSMMPLFKAQPIQTEGDEARRRFYGLCILSLTPTEHTDVLYPLLHDSDMFIQAMACTVFGLRKVEDVVPQLAVIAVNGTHNGRIAAIRALGMVGSPAALHQLLHLIDVLRGGWDIYLAGALEDCGCETAHDRGHWRYRLPGSQQWIPIELG